MFTFCIHPLWESLRKGNRNENVEMELREMEIEVEMKVGLEIICAMQNRVKDKKNERRV